MTLYENVKPYVPCPSCTGTMENHIIGCAALIASIATTTPVQARPFTKHDDGKNLLHLLPHGALLVVGDVLTYGAKKYAPEQWRNVDRRSRYYAPTLRHLFAWWRGEQTDPETGLSHLAHAACCILFLLEAELDGLGEDDRPAVRR